MTDADDPTISGLAIETATNTATNYSRVATDVPTHKCCWHDTGATHWTYPPMRQQVCCHCGARLTVTATQPPIPTGHGPYYPRPFSV